MADLLGELLLRRARLPVVLVILLRILGRRLRRVQLNFDQRGIRFVKILQGHNRAALFNLIEVGADQVTADAQLVALRALLQLSALDVDLPAQAVGDIREHPQQILRAGAHALDPVAARIKGIQKAGKGLLPVDDGRRPILRNIYKRKIHRLFGHADRHVRRALGPAHFPDQAGQEKAQTFPVFLRHLLGIQVGAAPGQMLQLPADHRRNALQTGQQRL